MRLSTLESFANTCEQVMLAVIPPIVVIVLAVMLIAAVIGA